MSDEELTEQRSILLAHKAASEEATRAEVDHDRVEREKERQAASLRKIERHTAEQLKLFQIDQEMLRDITNDEQKVRAAKLLVEVGQGEVQECDRGARSAAEAEGSALGTFRKEEGQNGCRARSTDLSR